MLNFLPIMLKIMPDYASKFCKRVDITILIEQEMTILSFTRNKKWQYWVSQETRNDNIEFHKKQEMTQQFYAVLTAVKSH